jgi:hypothetical protein
MAVNPIVEAEDGPEDRSEKGDARLLGYCMQRVTEGERYRDQNYAEKWEEYYRLWRGVWAREDQQRSSERSKLISPALQSAVESTVAEQEEAVFGRNQWFDLVDDYQDRLSGQDKDLQVLRHFLMDQFDTAKIPSAMSEIFLNAALYGTGIGKIITETVNKKKVERQVNEQLVQQIAQAVQQGQIPQEQAEQLIEQQAVSYEVVDKENFLVKVEPVSPFDFVIDPAARTIEEAEFCAHVSYKPLHQIIEKQMEGIYNPVEVGEQSASEAASGEEHDESDAVKLTEYYGLVPESLLDVDLDEDEELVELGVNEQQDGDESKQNAAFDLYGENLVEAIITIANDSVVLRAIPNPFWNDDRPLIAYQHDTVPNSFWGRGVCEKGYNAQKALDAELRARMDGLALTVHPMMGIDATRMPRTSSFTVSPGKSIPTNGNPREILSPFNFGQVDPAVFQSTGDLERMVGVATGTNDPSAPLNISPTNSTASGMSMALSSAIKRSKRTLANIERNIVKPFLYKAVWRFMQFDEENFPVRDINFVTHTSLGITARELEQQQLIQLLQTVPPESPAFMVMLKAIYDNSSLSNKEELVTVIEQMMQPDPQAQELQQLQTQLAIQKEQAEIEERQSRTQENLADRLKTLADIELGQDKLDTELQGQILDLLAARANKQNGSEMNGITEPGNGEVLQRPAQPNQQG